MERYSFEIIKLKNLKNNLKIIKNLAGKDKKILIPVKCNGYGIGNYEVSYYLEKNRLVEYLGVAYPFEGISLRKKGINLPILIFGNILTKEDYNNIFKYRLTPTILTIEGARQLNKIAIQKNKQIQVHINIDTGMGRVGLPYKEATNIIRYIKNNLKKINIEGIYSHLAAADEKDKKFTLNQINIFSNIINSLHQYGIRSQYTHILNSAGIINYGKLNFNMIRPGIMFYGFFPDNKIRKNIKIKPVVSLFSYISFIKISEKNSPISYGHTYFTKEREKIATISIGYGDGINRLLSNNGEVIINGKKAPIRGRICMDQFMVDVTKIKNIKIGDKVLIFGEYKNNRIYLENIAQRLNTIPYEIICNIGERVEKIYK